MKISKVSLEKLRKAFETEYVAEVRKQASTTVILSDGEIAALMLPRHSESHRYVSSAVQVKWEAWLQGASHVLQYLGITYEDITPLELHESVQTTA